MRRCISRYQSGRGPAQVVDAALRLPDGEGAVPGVADRHRALPRQVGRAHQAQVDGAGALAAFADGPDHQRLAAAHVAAGEDLLLAGLVLDRVGQRRCRACRARRPASLIMPSCTGPRKPMASSTRSALSTNSVPGIGWNLSSARAQCSALTTPFSPSKRTVATAKSRTTPSSWRRGGAHLHRPVRPGERLVLLLGRGGHDLDLGDRERALAVARCRCSPSRCRRRRSPRRACRWRGSA